MNKKLYIKPEVEAFEFTQSLHILNSTSLGGIARDWEEEPDEDWGEFIPYE